MNKLIPIVVGVIVIAGGSFYAGTKYADSQNGGAGGFANLTPAERQARLQRLGITGTGGTRGTRGANGAGFVTGEILSEDAKSVTVKLRDGGSKIVFLSDATQILKATQGSSQDLKVGEQVTVNGSPNTDGSVTAQSIQIRPSLPTPTPTPTN